MARLVVAAVFAYAAYQTGGLFGLSAGQTASAGFLVGSMVGATFEPNQQQNGPKAGDATVTSSSYGMTIPYQIGQNRTNGNIVWASARREIAHTTHQGGKGGGGGVDSTTYTYEQDMLVLLSENELSGIYGVYSNNQVLWSTPDDGVATDLGATAMWASAIFYKGTMSQLPHPIYEAAVGTNNAPGYRGHAYIFFQSLQLGNSGVLPNLQFEVRAPNCNLVSDAIKALCARAGLAPSQYDVAHFLTEYDHDESNRKLGLIVSQITGTRSVIEVFSSAFLFQCRLSDKLYFVPAETGAGTTTVPYASLGVAMEKQGTSTDAFDIRRVGDIEVPSQMALTFLNYDAAHQSDSEMSDRVISGQASTAAIDTQLSMRALEAAYVVNGLLSDKQNLGVTSTINIGLAYAAVEPGDVIQIEDAEGDIYSANVLSKQEQDGVLSLGLARIKLLSAGGVAGSSAGISVNGTSTTLPVVVATAISPTDIWIVDAPMMLDTDNAPGVYYAVSKVVSADAWTAAIVFDSLDDVTYTQRDATSIQVAMGTALTTLNNWAGGDAFDETNTLDVGIYDNGSQLVSVTRDALLSSATTNAAMVGSEMIQYMTATLIGAFAYRLSGLLRGRKGTEWAMAGHVGSERFVPSLSGRLPLDAADLGRLRYYKGVTSGETLASVTPVTATPMGVNVTPLSPVDVRANRATTDTVLTWIRRTRMSTRLTGPLAIVAPLDEPSENYSIDVFTSGAFTTVVRTLTSTSPTATYSLAQQTADFGGGQTVLYLKVYQISPIIGRGYAATATV